ncbi:MAG: hypothetical protein M3O34_04130 [Chloroflexota bacterium]|nr:hypothetical protein [Chloroflexota bacterium]
MTDRETTSTPCEAAEPIAGAEPPDHGINLVSVVVALTVLAALVVGIFWALPAWFGSSVTTVTVRQ